uniref:Putative ovule protein n=1 Tax=Solanum chacoense TaxID=4108 RepID=A0A0V0H235_SOLCH
MMNSLRLLLMVTKIFTNDYLHRFDFPKILSYSCQIFQICITFKGSDTNHQYFEESEQHRRLDILVSIQLFTSNVDNSPKHVFASFLYELYVGL